MHTLTPWTYISNNHGNWHVESAHNAKEAGLSVCLIPYKREADAAFIVKAVNNHEALLSACKEALLNGQFNILDNGNDKTSILLKQAIAKAEGVA